MKKGQGADNLVLSSVGFKLTGACEYHCPFCCEPDRSQKVYPVVNFTKISEMLWRHGTKRLCFTGGDPLLYKELYEVLSYTTRLGFKNVLLTANGRLLKKNIKAVGGNVDAVRFSVHGIREKHDKVVDCVGSFEEMESAIAILRDLRVSIYAATVVTNESVDDLCEILKWCAAEQISHLFLFELMKSGAGKEYVDNKGTVDDDALRSLLERLRQSDDAAKVEIIHYDYKSKGDCVLIYGNGAICIDPYPGSENFQLYVGNIFDEGLEKIIERISADPENVNGYVEHHKKYSL
ncbi:MAG: hypothetical protein CVU73_08070 [Deltaproteobacteria bacterium HGW-Deltaproteobacteria-8]|jgi:MoaA/NifB/PqqE/SkfB family radical SAM enzyme|nr:MAG: hypothetical protein CVU73_08070 [Deltaproteobacteria bacterium HGW-Deltaproteobacteria-8]